MTRDSLVELLRRADAARPAPPVLPGLPGRVRRRARGARLAGRRVAPLVAAAAAMALAFLPSALRPVRPVGPARGPVARDAVSRGGADERLAAEVEMRVAFARALPSYAAGPARERSAPLPLMDPADEARWQADLAARTLVHQAEKLERELQLPQAAAERLRLTIQAFPQSHWAEQARARLRELETRGGSAS